MTGLFPCECVYTKAVCEICLVLKCLHRIPGLRRLCQGIVFKRYRPPSVFCLGIAIFEVICDSISANVKNMRCVHACYHRSVSGRICFEVVFIAYHLDCFVMTVSFSYSIPSFLCEFLNKNPTWVFFFVSSCKYVHGKTKTTTTNCSEPTLTYSSCRQHIRHFHTSTPQNSPHSFKPRSQP